MLEEKIRKVKEGIKKADFILIGAGAGFSAAAGLLYSGERFTNNFQEYIDKYKMKDMYSAGFYPFETLEEKWGYWAKHIYINRYQLEATELYKDLLELIKDKEYFVITTNVDSQFEKAGFDKEKIFEVQGNYGESQCSKACHNKVYDNEKNIKEMLENIRELKIPTELIPKCQVCGEPMTTHLRIDEYFIQDDRWYEMAEKYKQILSNISSKNVVLLELGVGYNTPTIIRYPFEEITYKNKNITLVRLNRDYPEGAKENKEKTISFSEDAKEVIKKLCQN